MLGLIQGDSLEALGPVDRLRYHWQRDFGTELTEGRLFGRQIVHIRHGIRHDSGEGRERRRLESLYSRMRQAGIDKVAFARDFPRSEFFYAKALEQMSCRYLYQAMAGDVGAYVSAEGGDTAIVFAHSVGLLEEQAILKLCSSFRYLMVFSRRDGEAVCRNLHRRYGLPVIQHPTASQIRRAGFALIFQPVQETGSLGEKCISFAPDQSIYRQLPPGRTVTDLELTLPQGIAQAIPEAFAPNPLLSEAAFHGLIDPGEFKINKVALDIRG